MRGVEDAEWGEGKVRSAEVSVCYCVLVCSW